MDKRQLHIVLQKNEADIICWMRSLKPGTVNSTVNEILAAESKGKLAIIPCRFPTAEDVENANCRFVIRDKAVLNFVAKIPRGKIKQTVVRVIRKHIRKNSELPPSPKLIREDLLVRLLDTFEAKINAKEATYAGMPDKYSFLSKSYRQACEVLFCEILKGFDKSGKGTINLSDIINAAYSNQGGKEQKSKL